MISENFCFTSMSENPCIIKKKEKREYDEAFLHSSLLEAGVDTNIDSDLEFENGKGEEHWEKVETQINVDSDIEFESEVVEEHKETLEVQKSTRINEIVINEKEKNADEGILEYNEGEEDEEDEYNKEEREGIEDDEEGISQTNSLMKLANSSTNFSGKFSIPSNSNIDALIDQTLMS